MKDTRNDARKNIRNDIDIVLRNLVCVKLDELYDDGSGNRCSESIRKTNPTFFAELRVNRCNAFHTLNVMDEIKNLTAFSEVHAAVKTHMKSYQDHIVLYRADGCLLSLNLHGELQIIGAQGLIESGIYVINHSCQCS